MSNRLKMTKVQAVMALHQRGWSQRRIARELGIDRETVGRYLSAKPAIVHIGSQDENTSKPAIVHTGSEGAEEAKPAIVHTGSAAGNSPTDPLLAGLPEPGPPQPNGPSMGSTAGRLSECAPFRVLIEGKVEQGLSAQRIWQDLKAENGFSGSYYSVLRFVQRLSPAGALPFRRLESAPAAEAQVDFGTGAPIKNTDGKRQRTHVFRIVLSHSRKAYSEAVPRQTTDAFITCLENAFHYFGGVPKTLVIDNLKAAVTKADWFDPELNPKIVAFCLHYDTVMLPTKPYTPRHKGKVERGVDYVQENALKARTFTTLAEQNAFLLGWESSVADTRIHGTTRKQVGPLFASVEKPALLPLPTERFVNFHEAQRIVHRDGHVEVERAYYSVPPEYLGHKVWARWDQRLVRVFNQRFELLATHVKHLPGSFSTLDVHLDSAKISQVERGARSLVNRAAQLGPHCETWAKAMLQERGIAGMRPLLGLLSLAKRHPVPVLEDACAAAHRHGSYRLKSVRRLIENYAERHEAGPLLDEHPLIRPLSEYGDLAGVALWDRPGHPGASPPTSILCRPDSQPHGDIHLSLPTAPCPLFGDPHE
jgi:transposase